MLHIQTVHYAYHYLQEETIKALLVKPFKLPIPNYKGEPVT